jgi:hypothetical protein
LVGDLRMRWDLTKAEQGQGKSECRTVQSLRHKTSGILP